jgi:hypothetical protein
MGLAAVLFALLVLRGANGRPDATPRQIRLLTVLLGSSAAALWLAVLAGTYAVFPLYRATPPDGAVDLAAYPRAWLLASASTAWLHDVAMEIKEHVPWIAAMLVTSAAFVVGRDAPRVLREPPMYRAVAALLAIGFTLSAWAGLLGILVNKIAPLE